LPIADVVHIARQTLAGLQYLFEQGLVHRNLEPANLMLALPAGSDTRTAPLQSATVKILDTSLSRSVFEETIPGGTHSSRLTYEGQLVGTPEYLAPEQARDAHACDIRADLYGLGCVLYHALTGAPPFQDSSPLGVVIRQAVEPPRPVAEIRSDVPVVLTQLLDRLLAKDPDARFATPAEALAALPANMEATPVAVPVFQSVIVGPAEPKVTIELVAIPDAARPEPAIPVAAPSAPNPPPQLAAEDIALIPVSPAFNGQRFSPLPRSQATYFWLAMLLGAFILLLAQSAAWMLAQLLVL
jgi:eukaryotic-like serine/threonine-protein kinase